MKHRPIASAIVDAWRLEGLGMGSIFDMSGLGGALAVSIIAVLILCYGLTTRWIIKGCKEKNCCKSGPARQKEVSQ